MKRPNRATRARACEGKVAHPTHAAARQQLTRLLRNGSVRLAVYRCKFCQHWHVGHAPKPRT